MTVTGLPGVIPSTSGRHSFSIAAAAGCAWTARTDAVWAEILPTQGQGNATPMLQVTENASVSGRGLTVTINSQQLRISQSGTCTYSVSPTSLDEGAGGGGARTTLNTGLGCPWTATSSESWLRVLSASGTGTASIELDLAENRGGVRTAFLTVAGIRVQVTQRAR